MKKASCVFFLMALVAMVSMTYIGSASSQAISTSWNFQAKPGDYVAYHISENSTTYENDTIQSQSNNSFYSLIIVNNITSYASENCTVDFSFYNSTTQENCENISSWTFESNQSIVTYANIDNLTMLQLPFLPMDLGLSDIYDNTTLEKQLEIISTTLYNSSIITYNIVEENYTLHEFSEDETSVMYNVTYSIAYTQTIASTVSFILLKIDLYIEINIDEAHVLKNLYSVKTVYQNVYNGEDSSGILLYRGESHSQFSKNLICSSIQPPEQEEQNTSLNIAGFPFFLVALIALSTTSLLLLVLKDNRKHLR